MTTFESVEQVEALIKQSEQYLYKIIMDKADSVGGLVALGERIGYKGIVKDVEKSKVYDLIRIVKAAEV